MASSADKITAVRNSARPNSARVASGRSSGGATLACDNLTGWPTVTKVHFVTYQIDSQSNPVAGTQLDCYGIVSGNNIGSLFVVDGTDNGNSIGDVVEMLPTAAWGQDLYEALTNQHSTTGTHTAITATSATVSGSATVGGTLGVTGVATFGTAPVLPSNSIGTAEIQGGAVTAAKRSGGFAAGTFSNSGTSNIVVTGLGFTPKCLITFPAHADDAGNTNYSGLGISVGAGTNIAYMGRTATSGANSSINTETDACILSTTTNGGVIVEGALASFDSDGFTISVSTGSANRQFGYLAMG